MHEAVRPGVRLAFGFDRPGAGTVELPSGQALAHVSRLANAPVEGTPARVSVEACGLTYVADRKEADAWA